MRHCIATLQNCLLITGLSTATVKLYVVLLSYDVKWRVVGMFSAVMYTRCIDVQYSSIQCSAVICFLVQWFELKGWYIDMRGRVIRIGFSILESPSVPLGLFIAICWREQISTAKNWRGPILNWRAPQLNVQGGPKNCICKNLCANMKINWININLQLLMWILFFILCHDYLYSRQLWTLYNN